MIDLKLVRQNPELMKDNIAKRNLKVDLDAFLALDKQILESTTFLKIIFYSPFSSCKPFHSC